MTMADFYGTPNGFRDYHLARGQQLVDGIVEVLDDVIVTAWLVVASEWLDAVYRSYFDGTKVGLRAQVREWPRVGAVDFYGYTVPKETVPREIEAAAYEAAWRQAVTPGALSTDYVPNKYKRVSVDGAVSVEYSNFNTVSDVQAQYAVIDQLLSGLINRFTGINANSLSGAAARV
jgi:hypothetical protein